MVRCGRCHKVVRCGRCHKVVRCGRCHKVVRCERCHKVVRCERCHKVVRCERSHKVVRCERHHKVVRCERCHKVVRCGGDFWVLCLSLSYQHSTQSNQSKQHSTVGSSVGNVCLIMCSNTLPKCTSMADLTLTHDRTHVHTCASRSRLHVP